MKDSKLERVNIICDSPRQEYQVHQSIIGEDITGLPSDKLEVIDSNDEGVLVKLNIKKNSEKVVITQLLELRDFISMQEMDFTVENINKVIEHTGFAFDTSIEVPRIIINMSEAELLNYHINIAEDEKENWKKLYIEVLKYVIYKQAICTDYSLDYGDNVYEYFPILYKIENFKDFRSLIDKVMIDLLDNKVLINCIESIKVFKKFKHNYEMNSYVIYKGRPDDLDNLDILITADMVLSLKQRYSIDGSLESSVTQINPYDYEASKNVPKNLYYVICESDEKTITDEMDYICEKLKVMDKYDLMISLVKPLEEEIIIHGVPVNHEMIKKIKIIGIVKDENLKTPEIKWTETEPDKIPMEVDGKEVYYVDNSLNMHNLIIMIEPYQKQVMEYDELKKKIKFMSLFEFLDTKECKSIAEGITEEEIGEFLGDCKYKLAKNSNIDLSGNSETQVAIIRDWEESVPNILKVCIDRSVKVHKLLEKNSAIMSAIASKNNSTSMTDEEKQEFDNKVTEINRIVAESIRNINISAIQYLEDTLLYDLTKLSLSNPEDTLVFKYIKRTILNSEEIWDDLSFLFEKAEVLSDNKKFLVNLIREICSNTLLNSMKLNNEIFKELLRGYVTREVDFVETCSEMNRYIISICLTAVGE